MEKITVTQTRIFKHDDKVFEVRVVILDNRYCVRVYLNDVQVSPEYSATLEVGKDFFAQYQEKLVDQLVSIAESDISTGHYFNI